MKFDNLRLAQGMTLKVYTSVAKGLKLKVSGVNSYVSRNYREKTREEVFLPPILNRVKEENILE